MGGNRDAGEGTAVGRLGRTLIARFGRNRWAASRTKRARTARPQPAAEKHQSTPRSPSPGRPPAPVGNPWIHRTSDARQPPAGPETKHGGGPLRWRGHLFLFARVVRGG